MPEDDRLIYMIFTAQQKIRTYLKNALAEKGVRVTPAQTGILFLLKGKDGVSMSTLSKDLSIDNSTMTGLIDRLQKSGFIRREAGTGDRRVFHIYITPEGREEISAAKEVIGEVNQEIKAAFSPQEMETFKHVLTTLIEKFTRVT